MSRSIWHSSQHGKTRLFRLNRRIGAWDVARDTGADEIPRLLAGISDFPKETLNVGWNPLSSGPAETLALYTHIDIILN
jgi:hypothetical protein